MAGSGRVLLMRRQSQHCAGLYYCLTRVSTRCSSPRMRVRQVSAGILLRISMSTSSRAHIGKVSVDRVSRETMLRGVADALSTRRPKTIFYANSYAVTLAESDPSFAAAMEKADEIFCDGFGVFLASRLLGSPIPERFAWPDWIERLGEVCRDNSASMFFLGAREGVAGEAAGKLESAVPGLRVHSHHGHFQKDDDPSRQVIDLVNRSGASVLLVGFGMPLQEMWITKHREQLDPLVVFSVGAMFDYVAGQPEPWPPRATPA